LPDEQIELMWGYMQLRADEERKTQQDRVIDRARAGEAALQADEAKLWKAVIDRG
jgi:hypothetical protein